MKKFQRKLTNPRTGAEKSFDCDIRCDQCSNLPNYYIEMSDFEGDYYDTAFYCEKHQPEQSHATAKDKKEWSNFVKNVDTELTPEEKARNEWLKANIALMEKGWIL